MSTQVQIRRGTTAQHSSFTGAVAELSYDTDLKTIRTHDGSTAGGIVLAKVSDITSKANIADLTTANVTENTNLYFTNARAQILITPAYDKANTATLAATAGFTVANTANLSAAAGFDKANTAYVAAVAVFDSSNTKVTTVAGVTNTSISNIQIASGVNQTGILTTANVAEVTNLYYTDERVQSNVVAYLTGSGVKNVSGNLNITGNLNVAGAITTFSSNVVEIQDPMIYLATNNPGDINDIGFVAHFVNPGYQHTGFVRDASDGVWKLFANVLSEPSNNTLDFTNATYSTLKVGDVQANAITVGQWLGSTIAVTKGGTGTTTSTGSGSVVLSGSPTLTGTVNVEEVSATGNVTSPYFYSQSDINLKKDLVPITGALDIVKSLDGYKFKWKNNDAESIGLIAQYVETVLPMLIGTAPDGSKTVLYNGIIAILLEAIKAQQVQIDEIKAKLNE